MGFHLLRKGQAALWSRILLQTLCAMPFIVAFWIGPNMADARSESPPVLGLACGKAPEDLCRSVAQSIAEHSQGRYDIRVLKQYNVTPDRESDLVVTVVLDGRGQDWLAAHLDWQQGPEGKRHEGPSLELSVMDAALTPQMYERYAKNLIRADAAIMALLSN